MPKASTRASLPTSSIDFALPPSSSNAAASSPSLPLDDANPLLPRFRRPSLLAPKSGYLSEARLHSPLVSSFTERISPSRQGRQSAAMSEESESDRERMYTDSSPSGSGSSENPTPPPRVPENSEEDLSRKDKHTKLPSTPPRRTLPGNTEVHDSHRHAQNIIRRLSFPLKQPRILNLLAESRPEENEVRSEAAFQRLITSCSELPMQPRTPRSASDRGRYPEEAGQEDGPEREDTPSDDDEDGDAAEYNLVGFGGSEPIPIRKPGTPAGSVSGDDHSMFISESPNFASLAMDVDMPYGSPSLSSVTSTPINHWRYTPPPTTSAVRSNKRKFDDRFDPYPTASKRRAVSPSLSHLRDNYIGSPISRNSRPPIAIPVAIPGSAVSSATSSPTISATHPSFPRPVSITSSPTLRASMGLASPILRPVPRSGIGSRRGDGEEREIEGAGEAVGGLSLV